MLRVDLHVHSAASFDCDVEPAQVAERCRRLGLAPVFLTDHNTIRGAARLLDEGGWEVVVGEEVMTSDGELIGLFLSEELPAGMTAEETVKRIKNQGGLVYLEHPFDPFRRHINEATIEALQESIDIVEVWNGRSDAKINKRSNQLAETLGAAVGAGSDAHAMADIGRVFVEIEPFQGAQDFLAKLRQGTIRSRRSGPHLPKLRRR